MRLSERSVDRILDAAKKKAAIEIAALSALFHQRRLLQAADQ
jgi:hypothetical protein